MPGGRLPRTRGEALARVGKTRASHELGAVAALADAAARAWDEKVPARRKIAARPTSNSRSMLLRVTRFGQPLLLAGSLRARSSGYCVCSLENICSLEN